jgi:ubiquinone/menaquinone biosynthesis C-methylase UbiE
MTPQILVKVAGGLDMRWKRILAVLVVVLALGAAAAWWNRAELKRLAYGTGASRDEWQQPDRVVEALGIQPGQRVADIGAGGGYFTFRFARAAGAEGKVYAVDVDADMTRIVEQQAATLGMRQVEAILAATDDPRLPQAVDLVFVCNTYHHLSNRTDYFRRVRQALRPGGRLAIVEFTREGNWFVRTFGHSTGAETIRAELEAAGYRLAEQHDFLDQQSFLVFTPR